MEEAKKEIIYIPVEDILPNRFQPRLTFDEKDLNELANSIVRYGVIQPIVVRPIGEKYEIIAGERRYKASIIAGLKKIPAVLMSTDDNTSAEIALLENLQRKNLTPIEEARSYKKLINRGFTQEDIAAKLGVSQPMIANKIRLLNLPDEVQTALLYNQISERHARSLLVLNDNDLQNNLLKRIISERLTVKQTEDEINLLVGVKSGESQINNDIPLDIQKFLEPQKEISKPLEENKEEKVEKDATEDMEYLDLKVPDVIDIADDSPKIEYSEEQPLINPFNRPDTLENRSVQTNTLPLETEKNEEVSRPEETMNMPPSPFTEDSIELKKELTGEAPEEPQKSIKEQLGEIKYEYKPPTVEDLNVNEDLNRIERIDADIENISTEKETSIDDELKNEYGELDLPKVINKVRDFANNLGSASASMEVSEVDLPDKYQITINIKKN